MFSYVYHLSYSLGYTSSKLLCVAIMVREVNQHNVVHVFHVALHHRGYALLVAHVATKDSITLCRAN